MRQALLAALFFLLGGCVTPGSSSPYASQAETQRRPAEAERLTLRAAEIMKSEPASAEGMLRKALELDLFHGPAHNNLGVLYLNRGEIYPAATEFEWARKLMPGHPDPRVNLALTLERAGRADEAMHAYATALEVMPEYMPAVQGLACLEAKTGRTAPDFDERLQLIAMRGESQQWREWARGEVSRRAGPAAGTGGVP